MKNKKNYLAFVRVYNLSPTDYIGNRTGEIEKIINSAISSVRGADAPKATEENMIFSFPQDISATAAKIPVFVKVEFLNGAVFGPPQIIMADRIRDALLSFFKKGKERGDVAVKISNSGNAARSPRS